MTKGKSKYMNKQANFFIFLPITIFLFVFHTSCSRPQQPTAINNKYVVVLSLDGFRSDYSLRAHTPTLDSVAKAGIHSTFRPSYPSNTFPNHYSMATGLYPDHHGLIDNKFYAEDIQLTYSHKNQQSVTNPHFYGGEPIWNTAQKQGINTATFFWVGSELPIQGMQPSIWKPYDRSTPHKNRADSVIAWLQLPEEERPHLIMWYIEEPDVIGHNSTPESPITIETIENLDSTINYFFTQARQLDIFPEIDFIILSDHGMATVLPEKHINLNDYLPRDSFHFVFEGVPALLYPKDGYTNKAMKILETVPHITAYKKEDIPEKYKFGTHPRISDIVIIPDMGAMVHFRTKDTISTPKATHGYDNYSPEMEAIFYAAGPSFKKGVTAPTMENINLYLLITSLLGIEPATNDGSEEIVRQLFK